MIRTEKEILPLIIKILIHFLEPEKIILFGSRGKGTNDRFADFDIAISGSKPESQVLIKIKEELEEKLGLFSFDLKFLDSVDREFKDIILKTGKVIYEK